MRVMAQSSLAAFWARHPEAERVMREWYKIASNCKAKDFNELKQTFGSVDYVPSKYTIFDVGGNKYRVICVIHYNTQIMYIREVLLHKEYDLWNRKNRG